MRQVQPVHLIVLGICLMVLGWVLPFLMVLRVLQSTFFLNFFSYTAQVTGLFIGIVGVAMNVKLKKQK